MLMQVSANTFDTVRPFLRNIITSGAIEGSALNREVVMKLIGGPKTTVDIVTASNSTVETDKDISEMTTSQLTHKLYQKVLST